MLLAPYLLTAHGVRALTILMKGVRDALVSAREERHRATTLGRSPTELSLDMLLPALRLSSLEELGTAVTELAALDLTQFSAHSGISTLLHEHGIYAPDELRSRLARLAESLTALAATASADGADGLAAPAHPIALASSLGFGMRSQRRPGPQTEQHDRRWAAFRSQVAQLTTEHERKDQDSLVNTLTNLDGLGLKQLILQATLTPPPGSRVQQDAAFVLQACFSLSSFLFVV
jgi:hypothetical protein